MKRGTAKQRESSTEPNQLPAEGWTTVYLRDVASMRLGKMLDAAKQRMGEPTPYLRNINVRWGGVDLNNLQKMRITERDAAEFAICDEDVLVCEGGEPGRAAVWDKGPTRITFQKAIHRIRTTGALDPRWLMYHLRHDATNGGLDEYITGSTIKHLTGVSLKGYILRLPPIGEQRRIVAKLQALLTKVSATQQRLSHLPTLLKRFRQSVLAAACSGRLTADWREANEDIDSAHALVGEISARRREKSSRATTPHNSRFDNSEPIARDDLALTELPASWCWVDLRFLMNPEEAYCYGVVQPGEDNASGPRLVRVCDLENGTVNVGRLRGIPSKVHEDYQRSMIVGGEILVSVVGTIGRSVIAPSSIAGANIARAVAKVPIREVEAKFVLIWLRSLQAETWMMGDAREVARKTLNLEQLRTLPVPLAPLAEQREIVHRVDQLFAFADQIESRLKHAQIHVDRLTQSLLAKAFRGELVPTEAALARQEGRTYESASELLERVRATRNGDVLAKGKRRKPTRA